MLSLRTMARPRGSVRVRVGARVIVKLQGYR